MTSAESFQAPAFVEADFVVICPDDSMINARIRSGDMAYIQLQNTVRSGEIAAVRIGDKVFLRRVWITDDCVQLAPENPQYLSLFFSITELDSINILGKVVGISFILPEVRT